MREIYQFEKRRGPELHVLMDVSVLLQMSAKWGAALMGHHRYRMMDAPPYRPYPPVSILAKISPESSER
jgi:hypothetical protein